MAMKVFNIGKNYTLQRVVLKLQILFLNEKMKHFCFIMLQFLFSFIFITTKIILEEIALKFFKSKYSEKIVNKYLS